MNTDTETLIAVLRDRMGKMDEEERIDLLDSLFVGYCQYCGADVAGRQCYCMRDD